MKVSPETIELTATQQQQFSVEPPEDVTWKLESEPVGQLSATGVYTAPRRVFCRRSVIVTATSKKDPAVHSSATIALSDSPFRIRVLVFYLMGVAVILFCLVGWLWPRVCQHKEANALYVTPRLVTLAPGNQQQFSAVGSSGTNQAQAKVEWSASVGRIDSSGMYFAPTSLVSKAATVTAVTTRDPKLAGNAIVQFSPHTKLSISPQFVTVTEAQPVQFHAELVTSPSSTNASQPSFEWFIAPSGSGHISPQGLYVAPDPLTENKTVTVVAKLLSSPEVQAAAVIKLVGGDSCASDAAFKFCFVIVLGAIGGLLHGMASLVNYVGNRQFVASWFWWYVYRPFIGGALALVLFVLVGGGFLTGESNANIVRVAAIAALAGLFSDQALMWLAGLVSALFPASAQKGAKDADPRKDKLDTANQTTAPAPQIASVAPATVASGTNPPPSLTISGSNFVKGCVVRVNNTGRQPASVTSTEIKLNLTSQDIANPGTLTLVVVNPDKQISNEAKVTVT